MSVKTLKGKKLSQHFRPLAGICCVIRKHKRPSLDWIFPSPDGDRLCPSVLYQKGNVEKSYRPLAGICGVKKSNVEKSSQYAVTVPLRGYVVSAVLHKNTHGVCTFFVKWNRQIYCIRFSGRMQGFFARDGSRFLVRIGNCARPNVRVPAHLRTPAVRRSAHARLCVQMHAGRFRSVLPKMICKRNSSAV